MDKKEFDRLRKRVDSLSIWGCSVNNLTKSLKDEIDKLKERVYNLDLIPQDEESNSKHCISKSDIINFGIWLLAHHKRDKIPVRKLFKKWVKEK